MQHVRTPARRIAGSFVSWLLFAFAFTGFFQALGVVVGLGGFCASGGPFVIATECPESVVLFAPLGLLGMFVAIALEFFLAHHFGTPLHLWAWPVLFVGLGVQFAWGAAAGIGIVTNTLVAVLAIVMGLVPWWLALRAGPQQLFLGAANADDEPFAVDERGGVSLFARARPEGEPVPPTPRDWAASLGLALLGSGLGAWLALLAFRAVGTADAAVAAGAVG